MDREKVIKGLELLAHWPDGLIIIDKEKWIKPCCEMAVALLKEQEQRINVLNRAIEQMPKPTKLLDVFGDGYAKVVRCKYCENKECEGREGRIVCGITGEDHLPDWYCADGERRTEEGHND